MSDPEDILPTVREWVVKAENDLKAAVRILTPTKDAPTDAICFHAQQCVEKYLKAVLVSQRLSFPKTHALHVLMELIPLDFRPSLENVDQVVMTEYATVIRYPDAGLVLQRLCA